MCESRRGPPGGGFPSELHIEMSLDPPGLIAALPDAVISAGERQAGAIGTGHADPGGDPRAPAILQPAVRAQEAAGPAGVGMAVDRIERQRGFVAPAIAPEELRRDRRAKLELPLRDRLARNGHAQRVGIGVLLVGQPGQASIGPDGPSALGELPGEADVGQPAGRAEAVGIGAHRRDVIVGFTPGHTGVEIEVLLQPCGHIRANHPACAFGSGVVAVVAVGQAVILQHPAHQQVGGHEIVCPQMGDGKVTTGTGTAVELVKAALKPDIKAAALMGGRPALHHLYLIGSAGDLIQTCDEIVVPRAKTEKVELKRHELADLAGGKAQLF